jgi:hypothetical protein
VHPDNKATIERALELARTGPYRSVEGLVKGLNHEGSLDPVGQFRGHLTSKQLSALMEAAQQGPAPLRANFSVVDP